MRTSLLAAFIALGFLHSDGKHHKPKRELHPLLRYLDQPGELIHPSRFQDSGVSQNARAMYILSHYNKSRRRSHCWGL